MESKTVLEAIDLRKAYGKVQALGGVSFQVSAGEIFGLIGPNGAGKTTLIKSILGIVSMDSGSLFVEGRNCATQSVEVRQRTAYLPSDANLYLGMKGRKFLEFALESYPAPDWALLSELEGLFQLPLDKKIRQYSNGMKRKLLLMQALCANTPLLLLDEATEALDPTSRIQLLAQLQKLAKAGKTILFSSHQLDEVERICERVAFLHRGQLLDCDRIENIQRKASRWIRVRFRGEMLPTALQLDGVKQYKQKGGYYLFETEEDPTRALRALTERPLLSLEYNHSKLADLYADLYGVEP